MNCERARRLLTKSLAEAATPDLERHLHNCPTCRRHAERLRTACRLLRDHHAELEPPPDFTARVMAALPEPAGFLGWAALRLLPATLALVLVLSAWCWLEAPSPSTLLVDSPFDDPLSWVLQGEGSAR